MYDNTEPTDMYEITTPLADLITTTQNNTWDVFNSTLGLSSTLNSTLNSTLSEERKRRIWVRTAILTMVYLVGIIGNATAIVILRIGKRRVRNRKHLLLLTSLAANDLVALLGMLVAMVVSVAAPQLAGSRGMCAGRVVLRVFGIGSVCIAVTMALERYLALTRPFFYQKQVTYFMIRLALLLSWSGAVAFACAPLVGVGLYYDATHRRCARYRNADTPLDVGYAIFYVVVGTLLCVILVYCNLAVIRALYAITSPHAGAVVRRVSRRTCARDHDATATPHNAATAEEVAFSRFMTTLSVLFMICWLPQMLSSVLYLALGKSFWDRLAPMSEASDVLMLLNYVLNPVLYVLMRGHSLNLAAAAHYTVVCFKRVSRPSGDAGRSVGRADAAQLRAEPRAVRAHARAPPQPRRRSALYCRVLQAEAQVIARVRVVLPAGGDHRRRQRLRQRAAAARARPHRAAAAHRLTNTTREERGSAAECSAAKYSAAGRSTAQHNTAGSNTAQHSAAEYSKAEHRTARCSTAQH